MQEILLVDDDEGILSALKMLLMSEGYDILLAHTPAAALHTLRKNSPDLILMDLNYSLDTTSGDEGIKLVESIRKIDEYLPVVVMTGWATIEVAVSTMKNGANDFIQKPWENDRLIAVINNQIKLAVSERKSQKLTRQNQLLQQQVDSEHGGELINESGAMKRTMAIIDQVAMSDASVLLTGENGTGKSMFARYIHEHSARKGTSQISVNMGAVTETLFESEMFGHVKGAFTDANATRIGRFELADGGTLFLDEIANTPYSQQGKLLYEKVGANRTELVDVRLISATNADMTEVVASGEFRKDLLYRINTIAIEIPPLRDRKEDIIPLATSFLAKTAVKYARKELAIGHSAQVALLAYDWPGNIRELSHVMERAQILCKNNVIDLEELGLPVNKGPQQPLDESAAELLTLEAMEQDIVDQRLSYFDGNALKAAKSLGLSRSAFYRRLEKIL
jgi:DNA-binding NtrC family response regulator